MSKIQWVYDQVKLPFCEQLKVMGWQWIEGDKHLFAVECLTLSGQNYVFPTAI
jgi:hypothetical protein